MEMGKIQGNPVHVLIIPFPAPGHVIPLLELTRRLLTHRDNHFNITFFSTPSSLSLVTPLLSVFPPPQLQPLIFSPPSPSSSNDVIPPPTARVRALHALSDPIIAWYRSHPSPPCLIISDFFCTWTHKLCSCLRVPRVVFYPSAAFSSAVLYSMWGLAPNNPENDVNLEVVFDDVVGSPRFKWFELSFLFRSGKPGDPEWDIFRDDLLSNLTSWGALFNTFSEMEKVYIDHFINKMGHNRVWAVGPLLQDDVAQEGEPQAQNLMTWLNDKADCSVIYICFGSLTALTGEESTVLRAALEYSKVQFVWCARETDGEEGMDINTVDWECDPNTAKNGLIVKGWAPQLAILGHRAIGGFVTHCGWNSIVESIWPGVVTVAWPMGADQYSNAQLVVDKLGLGFQVKCDGPMGVPDPQELGQLLVKSLSATQLERDRVIRLGKMAASTVKSGASGIDFDQFVKCLSECILRSSV
ncbi:flavonol 3-O-glucosyltransferase UGT89B1-like [Silene latifolia]|uniref:flavonol 3-O-glucosyltransferase UGT89B1-like n=1 Tax=Silene latifolia TaxID=37657 RepID=UPI003D76EA9D